jgi:hypothetical protein
LGRGAGEARDAYILSSLAGCWTGVNTDFGTQDGIQGLKKTPCQSRTGAYRGALTGVSDGAVAKKIRGGVKKRAIIADARLNDCRNEYYLNPLTNRKVV